MIRLPAVLALALVLSETASAAVTPPSPDAAAQAYVQGRLALAQNDLGMAAQRFDEAMKLGADDGLQRRSLDVAILAGDMKGAVRLANRIAIGGATGESQPVADSLIALVRAAGAVQARDWRAYEAARTGFQEPARSAEATPVISTLLEAYGLAGRGQLDRAIALVDPATARGIARSYFTEHRGHLLALAGRWPEAADAYATLVASEGANVSRLRLSAAAAALEAARADPKYRDQAITLLGGGPARDPILSEARAKLAANPRIDGGKLGGLIERPADGLALMFLRVATDLSRERAAGPALGFARLATLLAPAMPETWMVTADVLARSERPELALTALAQVPDSAPWADLKAARRAAVLLAQERFDDARALLQPPTTRPDATIDDWTRLAEVERRAENHKAAAESYSRAIAMLPADAGPEQAQLWFLRGSANELAGNWQQAESDLRRAVELVPENPIYLNYLGYSLLDRKRAPTEARAFIARAYELAPDNGAIIDSMGWAEYVNGNFAAAVQLLEKARAAEPGDPTIADHLGDALWKAGRRIEARHAWASAASLEPEAKLAVVIARKLDFGLDVALAAR